MRRNEGNGKKKGQGGGRKKEEEEDNRKRGEQPFLPRKEKKKLPPYHGRNQVAGRQGKGLDTGAVLDHPGGATVDRVAHPVHTRVDQCHGYRGSSRNLIHTVHAAVAAGLCHKAEHRTGGKGSRNSQGSRKPLPEADVGGNAINRNIYASRAERAGV